MTLKQQIIEIICADRWIQTDREQAAEKADKILALTGHELTEARAEAAAALEKAAEICDAKAVYANRSRHGKSEFVQGLLSELENILRDTGKNIRNLITEPQSFALAQVKEKARLAEAMLWTDPVNDDNPNFAKERFAALLAAVKEKDTQTVCYVCGKIAADCKCTGGPNYDVAR